MGNGEFGFGSVVGASGQVMLRHRMSTLFRLLSRPWLV